VDIQSGEEWIRRVEGVLKVSNIVTHFGWPIQRGMDPQWENTSNGVTQFSNTNPERNGSTASKCIQRRDPIFQLQSGEEKGAHEIFGRIGKVCRVGPTIARREIGWANQGDRLDF